MPTIDLNRRRILVVEDDIILAMGIIDEIEDHNGIVQEHVRTHSRGLSALDKERPDACIPNIRLGPDMVYELADRLMDRACPSSSPAARRESISRTGLIPCHCTPSPSR